MLPPETVRRRLEGRGVKEIGSLSRLSGPAPVLEELEDGRLLAENALEPWKVPG